MLDYGFPNYGRLEMNAEKLICDVTNRVSQLYDISLHKYQILFLDRPDNMKTAKKLYRKRLGVKPGTIDRQIEEDLLQHTAICFYTKDLGRKEYYYVFIYDFNNLLPPVLAEEIAHGEHYCYHISNKYDEYPEKFPGLVPEIVANLAHHTVNKEFGKKTGLTYRGEIGKGRSGMHQIEYFWANYIAKSLTYNEDLDVPFKDIFRGKDSKEVWNFIHEVQENRTFVFPFQYSSPRDNQFLEKIRRENKGAPVAIDWIQPDGETKRIDLSK